MVNARLLKPYLFRLSRNVALNRIKRNRRIRERDHEASHWLVLNGEGERRDERIQQVEAALARLPEKQRSVVVLKFYQNLLLLQCSVDSFCERVIDTGNSLDLFECSTREAIDGFEVLEERCLLCRTDSRDGIQCGFADGAITEPAMIGQRKPVGFIAQARQDA